MASTTPQAASPPTDASNSVFTILNVMKGILNLASNHYISQHPSVYCGQEPLGHGIGQHKDELMAIPSRLEAILNLGISDDDWLAMQKLSKILKYATAEKFDWENQELFQMLTEDFEQIYKRVLRIDDAKRTAMPPTIYYRPKSKSGGGGFEPSKA
ncbi:hypothetical protein HYX04_01135 [Candidatus Woesearchaeota archaeon]|nr:hypothetical protein [Candidatus Woesearchaeota archaeon]